MLPRFPIYVPTKGRWKTPYTICALRKIGAPFKAVVEPQEVEHYLPVVGTEDDVLVLPHQDKGLVATRNWIWDHAEAAGVDRFWTMDDNIKGFYRFNRNLKVPVADPTPLAVMEEFVERYVNVVIAGMNYFMFASRKTLIPPYYLNTRVYSNMLILTGARDMRGRKFRNEGFYNDDTDLCLRVLKDGWCTVLFNAFLAEKVPTMTLKGGMTPFYQGDGRWKMAEELRRRHPDVVKITRKWGRWQHHVDYRSFKRNRLRRRPDVEVPGGTNDFGMRLVHLSREGAVA